VGCRRTTGQAALRRFALAGGRVVADDARALPGRGAYACSDACVQEATRRRAWGRAFRAAVGVPPEDPTGTTGGGETSSGK
jgi:predicted RNA-binding protein YlxR (DUF448 family)